MTSLTTQHGHRPNHGLVRMSDTQLPKALQLAAMFDHPLPPDWEEMQAAAAELRRLHQHELANIEWIEKTEWVRQTARPRELGLHRADALKQRIDHLEVELEQARAALRPAKAGVQHFGWAYDFLDGVRIVNDWVTSSKEEAFKPGHFNQRELLAAAHKEDNKP